MYDINIIYKNNIYNKKLIKLSLIHLYFGSKS